MNRKILFVLLCCGCVLSTVIFGLLTVRKPALAVARSVASPHPAAASVQKATTPERSLPLPTSTPTRPSTRRTTNPPARKYLFFRSTDLGLNYAKLSLALIDSFAEPRYAPDLWCERVHFAAGTGICLAAEQGLFTKYYAVRFDKDLKSQWRIPLDGLPSRTRVSPSGRFAAITMFLSGHSYASLNFSTQTLILDATNGKRLADLETFAVTRDGLPFRSADFNFWGVTFARDENLIYATLWSQGKTYLVRGNWRDRSAAVIYENVECPSLSPDNSRIAFKKRVDSSRVAWRIHVLDLKTMTDAPTGEARNVDDQVEWLDENHLLYSIPQGETGSSASTDIWKISTAANGTPELFLRGAFSPASAVLF